MLGIYKWCPSTKTGKATTEHLLEQKTTDESLPFVFFFGFLKVMVRKEQHSNLKGRESMRPLFIFGLYFSFQVFFLSSCGLDADSSQLSDDAEDVELTSAERIQSFTGIWMGSCKVPGPTEIERLPDGTIKEKVSTVDQREVLQIRGGQIDRTTDLVSFEMRVVSGDVPFGQELQEALEKADRFQVDMKGEEKEIEVGPMRMLLTSNWEARGHGFSLFMKTLPGELFPVSLTVNIALADKVENKSRIQFKRKFITFKPRLADEPLQIDEESETDCYLEKVSE